MSIKSKVFAAAATLTLVGSAGMGLTATSASAATPSCGNSCVNWFARDFGTHRSPNFALDTLRQGEKVGQPQILFRTSNSDPALDYTISEQGLVSDFFAADLVSAAVNLHYGGGATQSDGSTPYPDLFAYEIQYAPFGVDSGLCAGVQSTAVAGEKVTLEPCGVSSKTVWIADTENPAGARGGYVPLINGSDTNFSHPYVLTYPANSYPTDMPRAELRVNNLTGFSNGAGPVLGSVNSNQLWGFNQGVLK
jgi:hypothetical protein